MGSAEFEQNANGFRMNKSDIHSASAATRSLINHNATLSLYISNSCFNIVYAKSHMLDALTIFSNIFADCTATIFSGIYQ